MTAAGPAADGSPSADVRLSVVVPAYREGDRIGVTVTRLRAALAEVVGSDGLELVVVDDGSDDPTAAEAQAAGADRVITLPANRGKGAAVRAGALAAAGRTIAFTDADLSYAPDQVLRLLAQVEAGSDMVVGNRRDAATTVVGGAGVLREVAGRLFSLATRPVLRGHYSDTQCGLKAFRRDVARRLFTAGRVNGFAFDVELFVLAERFGLSVTQVPVRLAGSDHSTVRVGADALRMLRDLLRIRRWAASGAYDASSPAGAPSGDI